MRIELIKETGFCRRVEKTIARVSPSRKLSSDVMLPGFVLRRLRDLKTLFEDPQLNRETGGPARNDIPVRYQDQNAAPAAADRIPRFWESAMIRRQPWASDSRVCFGINRTQRQSDQIDSLVKKGIIVSNGI